MAPDARAALDRLVAALEAHFGAVARDRSEDSPAVIAAAETLIDAFETYDEMLYSRYRVDTPFVVYDDSDEEDDLEEFADDEGPEDDEDELDDDLEDLDEDDEDDEDDDLDDLDEDDDLEDLDEDDEDEDDEDED